MDEKLRNESERLAQAWMRHDDQMLRDYLVADVEDPRINVQSILSRHFLIVSLFGDRFDKLLEAELRFAMTMNWVRTVLPELGGSEDLEAIAHALRVGADDAEGLPVPRFVSSIHAGLPTRFVNVVIPNYLQRFFCTPPPGTFEGRVPESVLNTFQCLWAEVLQHEQPEKVSLIEPACGSANDYRFLEAYGLIRLIDYRGFDLCEKNVSNARAMFPSARFDVGNIFKIDAQDGTFEFAFLHDLLEHLSIAGVERALSELSRVVRRGLCLGFFNMWEGSDHIVRPTDNYHWNTLSLSRVQRQLEHQGFTVQTLHIDTLLRWRFGCDLTHNKNAYTLLAEREETNSVDPMQPVRRV